MKKSKADNAAWEYALRLLNYRERSRGELIEKFQRKNFSERVRDRVIADLERLDLINDEKFARLWVRSRRRFKPRSARLISLELSRKGIEREIIESVLREEIPPEEEAAAVLELAAKRVHYYRNDPGPAAKRKLFAYLARRGFSYDLIKTALEKVIFDESPGD